VRDVVPSAAPAAAPPAVPATGPPDDGGAHRTSVAERGSFTLARCVCGWTGPARRARERARLDAREHTGES